jgi:hypothetical protein
MKEEAMKCLRCRPGDLARVVSAWNPALVGRIVLVVRIHKSTEWAITLLGEPGITLTKNRHRLGIGNNMLADDAQLEPIRDSIAGSGESTDATTRRPRALSQESI